jgi:hypothetical protein
MLTKLVAVKVLAALSVAGVGTGAAAGELPDPLQNLASEAAEIVDVEIPDPDLSPADDAEKAAEKAAKDAEKAAKDAEKAAEKEAKDAEKAAEESDSAKDPEKAAEKAAKDAEKAADKEAKDAEKAEKADDEGDDSGDAGKKPKRDNHGALVSECARTTKLQGRAKGKAISALARGDVDKCDLGEANAQ